MKYIASIILIIHCISTYGQVNRIDHTLNLDSLQNASRIRSGFTDTVNALDTLKDKDTLDYLISPDAPDADVKYDSKDSSYLDAQKKIFFLFGDAHVSYQTYKLKAAKIRLDMNTDIAYAEGVLDSNGKWKGLPHFSDGQQEFDALKMRYNFRTRKGIIDQVVTKYTDVFIRGTSTKFIGGDPKDTTQKDIVFNKNAILTTCNAEHPHFGIRSSKQKFIKDKMVVIGPSNLEIMGVPTPLVLPFGFFPVTNKRSAGLIIPRNYEFSQALGFGLRNIGYYLPMGQHFDLSTQFDIYTRGSWGVQISSNYNTRYKFSGTLNLAYSLRKVEDDKGNIDPQKSISIQWQHRQASQANPYLNFSSSVNIQRNDYARRNFNDAALVLNNTLSSNINLNARIPNSPFSFSASASHSANTRDSSVIFNLPAINVQMQRIFPFKRKTKIGDDKWYEQVSLNYSSSVQSMVKTKDKDQFSSQTFSRLASSFGVRHMASSDVSFRVLKYFNLSPSVNFREIWNLQSTNKRDSLLSGNRDTIYLDTIKGFRAAHIFDAALSLNTTIYGSIKFKKGFIRGFRHTIKPSISLNYNPSTDDYYKSYTSSYYGKQYYSIFEGQTYNDIPQPGKHLGIGYSINHIFEGKYFNKKDSTEKKFKLFDNLYMTGFYNFAADSFKMAPLAMSGSTRFFGGLTTISANLSFDFYQKDKDGKSINKLLLSEGKLMHLNTYNFNVGSNFSFQDLKKLFSKDKDKNNNQTTSNNPRDAEQGTTKKKRENPETFWQMFQGFYFNHNLSLGLERKSFIENERVVYKEQFGVLANSISTQGSIKLTKNWDIRLGNIGYDFKNHALTYPDFGVSRVLHCWKMTFDYQPLRGTYSFNIFANASTFNFLKLPYRKNYYDPRNDL